MAKNRLYPRSASMYDDVFIKCPCCHKGLVYFRGSHKYIRCSCGAKLKDRNWLENTVAYKDKKMNFKCYTMNMIIFYVM